MELHCIGCNPAQAQQQMPKRTREPPQKRKGPITRAGFEENPSDMSRLIEGVRDCAIFMLNPDGIVVSWNPGAERIKGYTADEIIGQHFSTFYTHEDRAGDLRSARCASLRRRESSRARDGGCARMAQNSGPAS
jgi:PAS domain-containing protein